MRTLVTAGGRGVQLAAAGAVILAAAWLPLTGAAVAVLTRRMHDRHSR